MQEANREVDSVVRIGKRGMEMKSKNERFISSPISFPTIRRVKAVTRSDADLALARERDADIYELCRETTVALKELRQGIDFALREVIEKLDADPSTLAQMLDECPSIVEDIVNGEFDGLTTESMIEYLEKLRTMTSTA
jgi:hypothetical protein